MNDIHSVLIVPEEEKYAPPSEVVEVSVVGRSLFITVYDYEETADTKLQTRTAMVPTVNVDDFLAAIATCTGHHIGAAGFLQRSSNVRRT